MKWFTVLSTLFFIGGNEVDNGGDPLRFIFLSGQQQAAQLVGSLTPDQLNTDMPANVRDWIISKKAMLADDLRNTHLIWQMTDQATCALTTTDPNADVRLSFTNCRPSIFSADLAGRLLLHETVHHMGIADEDFADAVAMGVYDSLRRPYVTGDSGFRLQASTGLCRKNDGEPGYNPNFFGECGDLRSVPLAGLALQGIILRGANLENVDLSDTDLSRAVLDDARLTSTKIWRTRFDFANLVRAYMVAADVRDAFFTAADLSLARFNQATVSHTSLSAANLDGVVAAGSTWQTTDFSFANFTRADFETASFTIPFFRKARFDKATRLPFPPDQALNLGFEKAADNGFRFQDGHCVDQNGVAGLNDLLIAACANLQHEDLTQAPLRFVDLRGSDLRQASLARVDLTEALLDGANFTGADLTGSQLTLASLIGTPLNGAILNGASLRHADLSNASLRQAMLQSADLAEAQLTGADLRGANLSGANLSAATLDDAQLSNAGYDAATLLPFDDTEAARRGLIFLGTLGPLTFPLQSKGIDP